MVRQAGAKGGAPFAHSFIADLPTPRSETAVLAALHDCVLAYQAAGFGRIDYELPPAQWTSGDTMIEAA